VNKLSDVPKHAAYSAVEKGLNCVVAPAVLPIVDFLNGVEKAVGFLPEDDAEEVRQETVWVLKAATKPKDNLSETERRPLRTLRTNADLTVLPNDKGKSAVVLNTRDRREKFAALLSVLSIGDCPRTTLKLWNGQPPSC
jgi:hypothetical protein